mmetsp:Transcript_25490/g.41354  ORF Transcript_25490/g.41354 Transcript_25490/m.41354 type:complete len:132 (+) Transcript_25490:52-447(+)
MRFAFSILLFTLAASLREKDTSDVSHVSLSQPDGVPEVMENGGFTEQDTASIALWIMGCYNSELEMFSKCIADECNKHLERKGYQAMVFTGSLGTSLLYFQEHVRLKWGKFAVKVFRLAGQIPITLIGDPL